MTAARDSLATLRLLDLPHASARALLASGVPVTLCVNPVEYHGPHLSLHNDRLIAEALARALHERLCAAGVPGPFVLADDLEVGVDPASGPGSRHTPFPVARRIVIEACRALAELGARRVVLMTFHGSPMHSHAIDAGVRWLTAHGVRAIAPLDLLLDAMIQPESIPYAPAFEPIADAAERAAMLRELPSDFHAGFFETSVALHLTPQSVAPSHVSLPPCPALHPPRAIVTLARLMGMAGRKRLAGELRVVADGLAWMAVRPHPGYTGRPHLANARSGELFAELILERYVEAARRVLLEGAPPPRPPFPWMKGLTLGGRLATPRLPLTAMQLELPQPAVGAAFTAARSGGTGGRG